MTEHGALVARVHTRPHPNADRLKLADVAGYQCVVGDDTQDGDIVLFFSSDLQLSEEYAAANNLVGYTDENGVRCGGYFPKNRKVRPQKFRGERSDGYIAAMSSLPNFEEGGVPYAVGDVITTWNNVPICNKFVSEATRRQQDNARSRRSAARHIDFPKHYDTEQFERCCQDIPAGSLITISEKLHGTSQRTGYLQEPHAQKRTWRDRLRRRTRTELVWGYVDGTRNTVCGSGPGYCSSESFRERASRPFRDNGLYQGEIIYYEVVGYTGEGTPIMNPYDLTKSAGFKHLGKGDFNYGCPDGACDVYVYRITQKVTHATGVVTHRELGPAQVASRCQALGVKMVPQINQFFMVSPEQVKGAVDEINAAETDEHGRLREGVVVRVDTPDGRTYALKSKTLAFKVAEGIVKEREDSVDLEEVS